MKSINRAKEEGNALSFIANIILVIVTIGLSSLFVLLVTKRKKNIAINIALGASKTDICVELFFEMLLISLSGAMLGIIASFSIMSSGLEFATVVTYPNYTISLVLIIYSVVITIVSVLPVTISIRNLLPVEILRTL